MVLGKKQTGYGKVTFLYGMAGVHHADVLTSADQVTPGWLAQDSTSGSQNCY